MRRLTALGIVSLLLVPATTFGQIDPNADHLPDTGLLEMDEPLDVVMVRGINYFAEREIADAPNRRAEKWHRDYSSPEAYAESVAENRERLRTYIGAVDSLPEQSRWWVNHIPDVTTRFARDEAFIPTEVGWEVFDGVTGEGYLLTPTSVWPNEPQIKACVVVVPDAGTTPEAICGLDQSLNPQYQLARRLAESGCLVLVISPINRDDEFSGNPDVRYTNLPHREFVYRMAFEMGRHIIGFEVQRARTAISALKQWYLTMVHEDVDDEIPLAIAGIGEGGLVALHAAAVDPQIDVALVSGYFGPREEVWQEPIYRNVWRQLTEFSDADVASLIAPRHLIVEAAEAPEIDGPPPARDGRSNSAAPGRIRTPTLLHSKFEFANASEHYARLAAEDHIHFVESRDGPPGGEAAFVELMTELGIENWKEPGDPIPISFDAAETDAARQQRQFDELVRHTQRLMHSSDKQRAKFWSNADRSSVDAWVESAEWYRDHVHEEMIGKLPEPTMPLNPRTRKVIDESTHVGYEVVFDCYPAGDEERPIPDGADTSIPDTGSVDGIGWAVGKDWGVIAGGILLLPKDLKEGEQRPVVVCQHGLEGTPMATITTDENDRSWAPYKGFSTELVKRGFIVYAPQNPYRGHDAFRVIQRKSNPMGRSLFSYIIEQHRQTLKWLASLPYVDGERIGFYGLSYGGKTAVRVPPLLPPRDDQPGYCLSICSADFNEWVIKNVSSEDRYSYIFTGEYEMFEWNLGHVANYAELSSLMTPRPFMVERGHNDGVAPDEWVAWEYAKVRRHYDQLGIGGLTEIEFFNGPHTINGQGTYRFLHKHLDWPER